ncbi:metallophosphoesterase family protein [Altererythrobacter sp. CAU 1778]
MRQLFNVFRGRRAEPPSATIPAGERVYAVGDIHGRLDLFRALLDAIEADDLARGAADTTIVLLGDLVDRGPESAGVVTLARELAARRKVRLLAGNHEEMLLLSLKKTSVLRSFLRHGGRETLLSYGYDRDALIADDFETVQETMRQLVPADDLAFIESFEEQFAIGDYLFVHAGIDPDVALDAQKRQDLLWIREPFLSHEAPFGKVVVHGHTISEEPEDRGNRIGVDTGAFYSGRLTALALEGTERRYLVAQEHSGSVSIEGVTGQ